jgi:putative protease
VAGREFNPELMTDLEGLANRGYTDGFYQRHPSQELQNYRKNSSDSVRELFVGEVSEQDGETGVAVIDAKNKFAIGDELQLLTPSGNHHFKLEQIEDLYGNSMNEVPGGGYQVRIPLPVKSDEMGLLTKYLNR